jgi:molybdopterin-guanine dinucleotide biosynthesis protein A
MSFPHFPEPAAIPREPVTIAIVAGGAGARMGGAAKAFLDVGGRPVLDRQIEILRPRCAEILVAVAPSIDPAPFASRGLRVVIDRFPGAGPMAGLHAALAACATPWVLAVASDMPTLDGDLIDRLIDLSKGADRFDALIPRRDGRPEPLHALYRAAIAVDAEICLREGRRAMTDLLDGVRTRYIEEDDLPGLGGSRSFANLNTPEDLAAARRP